MPRKQYLIDVILASPRLSFITGALLILMGFLVSDLPKMVLTRGWQPTPGVISFSQIQKKRFPEYDGDYYEEIQVHLQYEYTVNGTLYTSESVSAIDLPFYSLEVAERYPVEKEVTVYYNPRNPAKAVLEPGFVDVFKAFDVFSFLFFAAAIYFIRTGILERKERNWRATFQEDSRKSNQE